MADLDIAAYLHEPGNWGVADPPFLADVIPAVGGAPSATDRNACAINLLNLAIHTPVALAYVHSADQDAIHICHTLTRFPAVLGEPTPMDNCVVALQGKFCDRAIPIVFPPEAFARIDVRALRLNVITGAAGHGAAPPVFRTGPHGGGVADTDVLNVRRAMVLPPPSAGTAVDLVPSGRYTHIAFNNVILNAGLNHADAAVQALWAPIEAWYRAASTDAGAAGAAPTVSIAINPIDTTAPANTFRLNSWAVRVKNDLKSRAGVGGPGLTNNVFNAGVTTLKDTMDANTNARLQFERDRNERSFTERHGTQLAQRMHRLCSVAADIDLPEVHRLLAKSASKSRDYAIINNLCQERCIASAIPLTASNSPLATTTLVDDVFRSFNPAPSGLTFARGLSPFAIVCEGHSESHELSKLMKQAEVAESSSSLSLADAERLTSSDLKFPTTPYFAGEKLYGWSIVVDVFHGRNTDIANAVRGFATRIVPHLHRIHDLMADTPAMGMDLVCRVLYEAQQVYFHYTRELGAGTAPACPTFAEIENKVVTYRVSSLNQLPGPWYSKMDAPANSSRGQTNPGPSVREQAGAAASFNAHADRRLLNRYRASGNSTISSLLQGHDVTVPEHGGQPVCLTWALKGECSSGCRRKRQHVRYSRSTNQAIHALLDACGVANSQE